MRIITGMQAIQSVDSCKWTGVRQVYEYDYCADYAVEYESPWERLVHWWKAAAA